jgi:hypothetical protein
VFGLFICTANGVVQQWSNEPERFWPTSVGALTTGSMEGFAAQRCTGLLADYADRLLIVRGVNLFPTQVEEIVLRTEGLAPHFQLVLAKKDRMDHMTVRVEARPETSADRRRDAATELVAQIKDGVGVSVAVDVLDPDTLERSVGKLRRVVDQRR